MLNFSSIFHYLFLIKTYLNTYQIGTPKHENVQFSAFYKMSQFDRSELMCLSEQCHQKHLYKDAINYMKEAIKMSAPLNCDERQILFQCFIGLKQPYHDLNDACGDPNLSEKVRSEMKAKAENGITTICEEAIELLNNYRIKRDESKEAVADYRCYLADQIFEKAGYRSGEDKIASTNEALFVLYEEAFKIACENLSPAHPVRLNIAYQLMGIYDVLRDDPDSDDSNTPIELIESIKEVYKSGFAGLPELPEELRHCTQKFLVKIKDKIVEWSYN